MQILKLLIKFHFIIPLGIILIPLLPKSILRKVFFFPIILPITWLIFSGCPITNSETNKKKYIHLKLDPIFPNIKNSQVENLITIVLMLSVIISTFRLIN